MGCTFTKIRLLKGMTSRTFFVECLNSECTIQLPYIRGLHSMVHKAKFSSPSLSQC